MCRHLKKKCFSKKQNVEKQVKAYLSRFFRPKYFYVLIDENRKSFLVFPMLPGHLQHSRPLCWIASPIVGISTKICPGVPLPADTAAFSLPSRSQHFCEIFRCCVCVSVCVCMSIYSSRKEQYNNKGTIT